MHKEITVKLDKVCKAVNSKKAGSGDDIANLKAQIEESPRGLKGKCAVAEDDEVVRLRVEVVQLKQSQMGVSTFATFTKAPNDLEELVRLRLEQADTKAAIDQRFESLEEVIRALRKQCELAEANADVWSNEALRSVNKRGSVAIGPTPGTEARVRLKVTPIASACAVNQQIKGIVERHQQEVDLLKEMRLKEVNARKESEEEVDRLKEAMARLGTGRKTKGTNLKTRMDIVAGVSTRKDHGVTMASPMAIVNARDSHLQEETKKLRLLKKEDVLAICEKEGIDYTTLEPTKEEIAQRRTARVFDKDKGKKVKDSTVDLTEGGNDDSETSGGCDSASS
ncbi:hypothetical protein CBR_g48042 [Chara braunii]|uniref:Uncharacterized protein n=1 Tax=Chara braunii TaxID=69332 RepID=A0A388M279_CHABU|nr:hypothetical protein CBR_g48042 [Chara braunii]|eukprot:GBG88573.1 hypothetical protein CBR_g48042 [Chara braunii]